MQRLYDELRARLPARPGIASILGGLPTRPEIEFILLNAMEDYGTTLQWARRERYTLPLYDSRQTTLYSQSDWISGASLPISSGGAFSVYFVPRTYILDRNGIVVWTGKEQHWDWGWLDAIVGLAATGRSVGFQGLGETLRGTSGGAIGGTAIPTSTPPPRPAPIIPEPPHEPKKPTPGTGTTGKTPDSEPIR